MQWTKVRKLAILDFDLECRPLSWYGGDWVTKEITAIGAQFVGGMGYCWLLGRDDPIEMLEQFRRLYKRADVVTGHHIRGFDLPMLGGQLFEYQLPPLSPKMVSDTKADLVGLHGMSKSQENLAAVLGLEHPKVHMDQAKWRAANRLTAKGLQLTEERVMGDVIQHIELREKLVSLGMLAPPRLWTPGARATEYLP